MLDSNTSISGRLTYGSGSRDMPCVGHRGRLGRSTNVANAKVLLADPDIIFGFRNCEKWALCEGFHDLVSILGVKSQSPKPQNLMALYSEARGWRPAYLTIITLLQL